MQVNTKQTTLREERHTPGGTLSCQRITNSGSLCNWLKSVSANCYKKTHFTK